MKILAIFAGLTIFSINIAFAAGKETFSFPDGRQVGQVDKVTCQFDISGEALRMVSGKEHREKISDIHHMIYDEKTLAVGASPQGVSRSARYYDKAEAVIKHGDDVVKFTLRDDRRLIGAEMSDQAVVLFSPRGPLSQDELESIDILGNSLLLNGFLPDKPVAIGDTWKHSDKLIGQLLWLDNIGQSDVQSTLKEVTDKVARFGMKGKVLGTFKEAASEIEIEANYRYDRRLKRIDWLGMRVAEQRKSSSQTDRSEVVARAQVLIVPAKASEALSDAALKNVSFIATPELLQTTHQAKQGNWEITYDRCWNAYQYLLDKAEMHLLDRGDVIAQCNISSLPQADPGKMITREAYQEELRGALDKSFGAFVETSESLTTAKYRLLRVVISGTASDLPMRWIYYHVADQQGRQAVFVFVVEEKLYDRLAGRDKTLIDSFRFMDPPK